MPRYSNRRSITSSTTYQPASFTPAGFEAAVFTPQSPNLSYLQKSLDTLDQRKENTDKQAAAIRLALNQVNLNSAEDEWKRAYIDEISNQIDNAAQFGDYSAALETATELASTSITDPRLTARVRRNEQYQTWRKDIEDRALAGKIDRRTANRILEQNPYNFTEKVDDNGNVIGGYDWNETGGRNGGTVETPVNKLSLEPLFKEVDAIVAQHVEGGAGITSRNAKGEIVSNYDTNAAFATKSSSTVSYKDEKVIQDVFNELVKMHPELTAYLEQMKRDDEWEIKKLENSTSEVDKAKLSELKRSLYTDNGLGIKSNADYLFDRSNKSLSAMAFRNYQGDISISGGGGAGTGGAALPPNTNMGGDGKIVNTEKTTINPSNNDKFKAFVNSALSSLGI